MLSVNFPREEARLGQARTFDPFLHFGRWPRLAQRFGLEPFFSQKEGRGVSFFAVFSLRFRCAFSLCFHCVFLCVLAVFLQCFRPGSHGHPAGFFPQGGGPLGAGAYF